MTYLARVAMAGVLWGLPITYLVCLRHWVGLGFGFAVTFLYVSYAILL